MQTLNHLMLSQTLNSLSTNSNLNEIYMLLSPDHGSLYVKQVLKYILKDSQYT